MIVTALVLATAACLIVIGFLDYKKRRRADGDYLTSAKYRQTGDDMFSFKIVAADDPMNMDYLRDLCEPIRKSCLRLVEVEYRWCFNLVLPSEDSSDEAIFDFAQARAILLSSTTTLGSQLVALEQYLRSARCDADLHAPIAVAFRPQISLVVVNLVQAIKLYSAAHALLEECETLIAFMPEHGSDMLRILAAAADSGSETDAD